MSTSVNPITSNNTIKNQEEEAPPSQIEQSRTPSNRVAQLTIEDQLYVIDLNDPIFQIDENDPICKEILENEEREIKEDLKFQAYIKSLNFHKCSDVVEEKVMNEYHKTFSKRNFL